ncbi:hypothetical protein BN8_03399 [Fibrisoma limi BUZ 3]|uniref:Uncharacterized protein n=1 Tax=Fibrisoma limi BUZ 3 TaxID=1185876 RepID=I2GK22_9BACT|nr:hypothetical protein BN8_03399 [Fibrisoma limi BUZ 3]
MILVSAHKSAKVMPGTGAFWRINLQVRPGYRRAVNNRSDQIGY